MGSMCKCWLCDLVAATGLCSVLVCPPAKVLGLHNPGMSQSCWWYAIIIIYTVYNAFLTVQIGLRSISKSKEYVNILWYVRNRFGTDQGSLFSVCRISLNAHQPFKSQWIVSRKSCWIPYLFSEKFRNRHSKELLPGSSDSHEEKERNFLLLFWRKVSFSFS